MSDQKTLSLEETKEKILEMMRYVAEARFVSKRKEAELAAIIDTLHAQQPASVGSEEFVKALIDRWYKDPMMAFGVPYRRMATDAAEVLAALRRQSARQVEQEVLDEIDKGGDVKCAAPVMNRGEEPQNETAHNIQQPSSSDRESSSLPVAPVEAWRDLQAGEEIKPSDVPIMRDGVALWQRRVTQGEQR